jgi:hypothetical protein
MIDIVQKVWRLANSIQLNLTQWLLLGMATAIGGLTVALKLQGSRLHALQVQLLEKNIQITISSDDNAVKMARDKFNEAYEAYLRNRS